MKNEDIGKLLTFVQIIRNAIRQNFDGEDIMVFKYDEMENNARIADEILEAELKLNDERESNIGKEC